MHSSSQSYLPIENNLNYNIVEKDTNNVVFSIPYEQPQKTYIRKPECIGEKSVDEIMNELDLKNEPESTNVHKKKKSKKSKK